MTTFDPLTKKTTVIPADTLAQTPTPINITPPPTVTGATMPLASTITPTTPTATPTQKGIPDYLKQYLKDTTAPTSQADLYTQAQQQGGIQLNQQEVAQNQQLVNDYSAQLNQINAELQANKLKQGERLAGMGEISGTQGKLERDAAIRALPISAQLNFAQAKLTGSEAKLQSAKNDLNTLFQLKSEDATNAYNYKQKQIEMVYDFATKQEQAKLDQLKIENEQKFTLERDNLKFENQKRLETFEAGLKGNKFIGFSGDETVAIKNDIATYGIDKVLEGVTDPDQVKAIQDVAKGVTSKVSEKDIRAIVTQKNAMEGLRDAYTEDELSKKAREEGFASFFKGKKGEIEKFLNSSKAVDLYVDLLYKQYEQAGMTK